MMRVMYAAPSHGSDFSPMSYSFDASKNISPSLSLAKVAPHMISSSLKSLFSIISQTKLGCHLPIWLSPSLPCQRHTALLAANLWVARTRALLCLFGFLPWFLAAFWNQIYAFFSPFPTWADSCHLDKFLTHTHTLPPCHFTFFWPFSTIFFFFLALQHNPDSVTVMHVLEFAIPLDCR